MPLAQALAGGQSSKHGKVDGRVEREGKREEGGSERALRRDGDEAAPAQNPRCLGRVADSCWHAGGTRTDRTGKEADEGGGFLGPAPTDFEPKQDEAAATTMVKLRVRPGRWMDRWSFPLLS